MTCHVFAINLHKICGSVRSGMKNSVGYAVKYDQELVISFCLLVKIVIFGLNLKAGGN
jgi:hypothetical protein